MIIIATSFWFYTRVNDLQGQVDTAQTDRDMSSDRLGNEKDSFITEIEKLGGQIRFQNYGELSVAGCCVVT